MKIKTIKTDIKQHIPEVLVGFGVVSVVVGTVEACKATSKATELMKQTKNELDAANECIEKYNNETYTKEDYKKDLIGTYGRLVFGMFHIYGFAAITQIIGIGCLIKSNGIYKDQAFMFSTAYSAVSESFKNYRTRVSDKYGEDEERNLRFGIEKEKANTSYLDENGKTKKKKEERLVAKNESIDGFWRIFDDGSRNFENRSEDTHLNNDYNMMFLSVAQKSFQERVDSGERIFLNDVCRYLDVYTSPLGQLAGWKPGDTVDFGITKKNDEGFMNDRVFKGDEEVILLQFNCRENIYNDWNLDTLNSPSVG